MKIKNGTTRTVILINNIVIKFPRIHTKYRGHRTKMFLRGLLANIDERFWWKSGYQRDKLARARFCFPLGLFLIMDRATELKESEYNKELFNNVFCNLPLDNKIQNFGKINNKIVLIDYADSKYMCSGCENIILNINKIK